MSRPKILALILSAALWLLVLGVDAIERRPARQTMAEMELAQRVWLRILDAVGQIQEREDLAMDSLPYKSTEWMMARERYETAEACYDAVCRLSPEQVLASLDAPSAERED